MGNKAKKEKVTEDDVLKALDELESNVEKGDKIPDEMKNPNGGLATEGEDLESEISASEGEPTQKGDKKTLEVFKGAKPKPKMKKTESMSEESGSEDDSESESESEEDMSKAESSSAGSEESVEKSSKKKEKVKKSSFRDRVEKQPELKKAMDVSNFLESLVDLVSDADSEMVKSIVELHDEQKGFNGKLAKAMISIGRRLVKSEERNEKLFSMVESLTEKLEVLPDPGRTRKSVLHKSEIMERNLAGRGENGEIDHNDPKVRKAMLEWMMDKSMQGKLSPLIVTQYEQRLAISDSVLKAAEPDLRKALS